MRGTCERNRRVEALACLLLLAGAMAAQEVSTSTVVRSEARMAAGNEPFRLAAVGDLIISRPVSHRSDFNAIRNLLGTADAAFGNFEGTAADLTKAAIHPQAESGGAWILDDAAFRPT